MLLARQRTNINAIYIYFISFFKAIYKKDKCHQAATCQNVCVKEKLNLYIYRVKRCRNNHNREKIVYFWLLSIISFPDYSPFPIGLRIQHVHLHSASIHVLMCTYPYRRMMKMVEATVHSSSFFFIKETAFAL